MTAAAPRTAAPEARMGSPITRYWHYISFACWADEMNAKCRCRASCRACNRRWLRVDAVSIENDLEVSRQFDTPAHRERQLAIWAERERRALVRSVAWA